MAELADAGGFQPSPPKGPGSIPGALTVPLEPSEYSMTTKQSNMKLLYERRDKLRMEMEALRARLDEVETLIRLVGGEVTKEPATDQRPRRGDLKEIVLSLMSEAGEAGLSSAECVTAAQAKRGVVLQPASVSSLLSRLKADGVLAYDGERYRLKEFAVPRAVA